jgi:hypothetical protein
MLFSYLNLHENNWESGKAWLGRTSIEHSGRFEPASTNLRAHAWTAPHPDILLQYFVLIGTLGIMQHLF